MRSVLILCVFGVVSLTSIHIRPENSVKEVYIKIGEEGELDLPDFDFTDIYSREIRHVNSQQQEFQMNDLCKEASPEVNIKEDVYYEFTQPQNRSKAVVFDFEDL